MVHTTGFEPVNPLGHQLLKLACLPISPDVHFVAAPVGFEPTHGVTRLSVFKTDPFNHLGTAPNSMCFHTMERVAGVEPALSAWQADVLPLNYTRASLTYSCILCENI